jgi:hypothetical protein
MKKIAIAGLIAASMLSACATNVGTQTVNDFGRFQQAVAGQTTKTQIHDLFGQPHRVTYIPQSNESLWQYYQVRSTTNPTTFIPFVGMVTGGNDLDITRADFFFDAEGILLRTQREQRTRYKNQWLGMADALTRDGSVAEVEAEMQRLNLPFDRQEAQIAAGWADWDD